MTRREELERLAARVESLTGACRETDATIQRALGDGSKEHWFGDMNGNWVTDEKAPAFTNSIDAAMTLVPEGWNYCLTHIYGRYDAVLNNSPDGRKATIVYAATPALALTAAALRAIAAQEQTA